jgi:hypothetical protein
MHQVMPMTMAQILTIQKYSASTIQVMTPSMVEMVMTPWTAATATTP